MITTHVLDTSLGRPGSSIAVELERVEAGVWHLVGGGITDSDGRLRTLTPEGPVQPGVYRIRFQTGPYFEALQTNGFFPVVEIHAGDKMQWGTGANGNIKASTKDLSGAKVNLNCGVAQSPPKPEKTPEDVPDPYEAR